MTTAKFLSFFLNVILDWRKPSATYGIHYSYQLNCQNDTYLEKVTEFSSSINEGKPNVTFCVIDI